MLKMLLGNRGPDKLKTFQNYIIAVSFPKMIFRIYNRRISTPYFACFKKMESMTFDFTEHNATTRSSDKLFLDVLPSLSKLADISNLLQAKKAKDAGTPSEIYNKDTYMEFHGLLFKLLDGFHKELKLLDTFQTEMANSRLTVSDLEFVKKRLQTVRIMGRSLRAMVSGAAIEKYLQNIAHLLEVDNGESWTEKTEEDADFEAPMEEDTDEYDAFKPYSMHHDQVLLPWQSYKDWLRLTVTYFEASQILIDHVSNYSTDTDIDIKILAPSLPTDKMLPWMELLRHKTYFPELPNKPGQPEQPSAQDLITFFTSDFDLVTKGTLNETEEGNSMTKAKGSLEKEKGVSLEQILALVKKLKDSKDQKLAIADIELIIKKVSQLNNCSSPGWIDYTSSILDQLNELKDSNLNRQAQLPRIRAIEEGFETLSGHSRLYQMLKYGTPLSLGTGFKGTRHCELCLAAFNSLSPTGNHPKLNQYISILNEFAVRHIFMLYSNVCSILQYRLVDML
jgi:hypothetical protein